MGGVSEDTISEKPAGKRPTPCLMPEVFDPTDEAAAGWLELEDLNGPPDMWIDGHAVLDDGKRIIVHSPSSPHLYAYDVEANSWDLYRKDLGQFAINSAFVDGILYYFDYKQQWDMYGLDLSKPENIPKKVEIKNLNDRSGGYLFDWIPQIPNCLDLDYPTPRLVSLGNRKLAAIWRYFDLYCSKFEMSKKNDVYIAHPLRRSRHDIPDCIRGPRLTDCLAVFPSQTRGAQEDSASGVNKTKNGSKKKRNKKNRKGKK